MRYHNTPIRMSKTGTLIMANDGEYVEQQEVLVIAGGNAQWHSHFGRQFGGFLKKLNILSP